MAITTVRLTSSFLRKAIAPGEAIARVRGAERMGVSTSDVTARITAQHERGKWIEWTVTHG